MTTATKGRQPVEAERAYTLKEAAALKGVSHSFILKAIHSTGEADPSNGVVTPRLVAKKVGKGYRVGASALEDWFSRLEDA